MIFLVNMASIYVNWLDFWFPTLFLFKVWKQWPMWKKISQKRAAFAFKSTYLHQTLTECVSNTHILIYRHTRCDCKLWNILWFYSVFGYFHIYFYYCRKQMFFGSIPAYFSKLVKYLYHSRRPTNFFFFV